MDYKEKYVQALERARQFSEKPYLEDSAGIVEYIFPELSESKDERIRKRLAEYFEGYYDRFATDRNHVNVHWEGLEVKEILAWLEKQGEQKPADKKELKKIVVPIFNIGDIIAKKHNSDINDFGSFTITDIADGKYWYNDRIICDVTKQDEWELYEPVRQNPAELSEDDETYLDHVFTAIKAYYSDDKGHENPWREELLSWLKSLRPKSQWKPSDEQIYWLKWATGRMLDTEKANEAEAVLKELLADLKKLTEE